MFGNYFIGMMRSLIKHKLYGLINILSLSIGIAACLLIFMYISHETSYDKSLSDLDRLYRIETQSNIPGRDSTMRPRFVGPTYDLLPQDFSEVEYVVRLRMRNGGVLLGSESFLEDLTYTDPEFFSVFNLPFIEGSVETALKRPSDIILTKEMAIKYLGKGPYLGNEIVVNDVYDRTHVVSGVIENIPENSHLELDILLLHDLRIDEETRSGGSTDLQRWNGLPFNVYIKLKEGGTIDNLKAGINDWMDKYFPANISRLVDMKGSELFTPKLIKVSDIHLYSQADGDMKSHGSLTLIYSFSVISALILFIAIINFMNLATARATLRSKEIAMRKVLGASRSHLFIQFEVESMWYAMIALLVAIGLTYLALPYFSDYTDRVISIEAIFTPLVVTSALLITLLTGFLAGLYPAYYLSGLRPSKTLNSNRSGDMSSATLRSILVIFQFAISATLIILTCLIFAQTSYSKNRDLGYDRTSKMVINGLGDPQIAESKEVFKKRIADIAGVHHTSLASFSPGQGVGTGASMMLPGESDRMIIFIRSVDANFFPMYEIEPLAGRLFDESYSSDRLVLSDAITADNPAYANVVINQLAVRRMGFASSQDAIGQIFYRGENNELVQTIIGVVPDIHFVSPRDKLAAEIYYNIPADYRDLTLEYDAVQEEYIGGEIDKIASEMYPRVVLHRLFLEEEIASQFAEERTQGVLLALFSGLAIFVACMGLYGLSSFTIDRRTKEIGIRKVHGASMLSIMLLLLKHFSIPVLIANILVWPLAYYAINEWLLSFEYRLDLQGWFAVVAGTTIIITMAIAWVTVTVHAWRVARTNPVHALRYE